MMKHLNLIIKGRVQKVGFRFHAMEAAYKYGIAGFVMNRDDDSVYIEAEGTGDALESFIGWCHRGPIGARVEEVKVSDGEMQSFTSFEIISRAKWMNTKR